MTPNAGAVGVQVPRDREGGFEPVIVRKRQRRLSNVDAEVLSLYARGLTTGEISAHFAGVYGASVSKDTVSRISDKVVEDMQAWSSRPLQQVYAAIFIDAIMVKVRDGQVGNQPFKAAIGVDPPGHRDVLGLWAGTGGGGESAKFWMAVLTDIKKPGRRRRVLHRLRRPCWACPSRSAPSSPRDRAGLHHPPDPCWSARMFRYASKRYWEQLAKDLRPIYTAATADAAWAALEELEEKWGKAYPAIPRLWRSAWEQNIGVPGLRSLLRNPCRVVPAGAAWFG